MIMDDIDSTGSSSISSSSYDSQFNESKFHEFENNKENLKCSEENRQNELNITKKGPKKYASEVKIYKITVPVQKMNLDNYRASWQYNGNGERRQKRSCRKKAKRKPCQNMGCGEDDNFSEHKGHFEDNDDIEEPNKVEDRKKNIRQKLSLNQDHFHFSKLEEKEIHERAEIYSLSIFPDPNYYVLPTNGTRESANTHHLTSMYSYRLAEPYPKKRKRRNYMTDFYYLTGSSNQNDCSQHLSSGTKLMRPPDKLVELVYQAVESSPDGLLQVPQIYAAIMNRYPYFRCMDRSALGSWRSSIRHALYQKWFRKIKFCSTEITSKGCYWAINKKYNLKEMTAPKPPKKRITRCYLPFHINIKDQDTDQRPEDFDLDPNTHEQVIALLTEEEEKELEEYNPKDPSNIQDVMDIAREYGFSLTESDLDITSTRPTDHFQTTVPKPVNDPDPILSSCVQDVNHDNTYSNGNDTNEYSTENSPAVYSCNIPSLSSAQNSYTNKFHRYCQQNFSPFVSPLMHNVHPDILGMEPRMENSTWTVSSWDECYVGAYPFRQEDLHNSVNNNNNLPFYLDHLSDINSDKTSSSSQESTDVIEISDGDQETDNLSMSLDKERLHFESPDDLFTYADDSLDDSCVPINISIVSN